MFKDGLTKFERFFISNKKKYQIISGIIIFASLPLIYLLVLATGGIKYSYSHTMYIPVVIGGFLLGRYWGAIIGIIGGILLGPALPIDIITMEQQLFVNWFFRLIVFSFIGFISGFIASVLKKDLLKIVSLYSTNPDTMLPNRFAMSLIPSKADDETKYLLTTVMINNNIIIMELLGADLYVEIVKMIFDRIKQKIINPLTIIQGGSNRIWVACKLKDTQLQIKEIYDILNEPISISGIPLFVDFSVGVTTVKGLNKVKEFSSFRQSDIAARAANKAGKPYEVFKPEHLVNKYDYELLGSFENALLENQTFLVYQPILNLNTKKAEGFEALIRWQHPIKGLITPDKFIHPVEQTKLIHQLTDWVINKVIQKINEFKKQNINIKISVNISVKNLSNPGFFDSIINKLEHHNINPSQLDLEITESMLMDSPNENISLLESFLNKGISTSLDDFGVGYSSLQYLARLPINTVKIDRFFIKKMAEEKTIKSIVKSAVEMSHNLGYQVVAEGIEDKDAFEIAKALKCDYAQGYYISRPMIGDKIIDWYKTNS